MTQPYEMHEIELCKKAKESSIGNMFLARAGDTDLTRFILNRFTHSIRRGSSCRREYSPDDLLEAWSSTCPILGIALDIYASPSDQNYPTLDRIVPEYGYVPGNIKWVSKLGNELKGYNTIESIKKVLAYMESSYDQLRAIGMLDDDLRIDYEQLGVL
jgi:hypothetical protein